MATLSSPIRESLLDWISEKSQAEGWRLDRATIERYADDLLERIKHKPDMSEEKWHEQLQTAIPHYHIEHCFVAALRNGDDPRFDQAWKQIEPSLRNALRQFKRWFVADRPNEEQDAVQMLKTEIIASLPTFAYQSKTATWAYGIALKHLCRYAKANSTNKRKVNRNAQLIEEDMDWLDNDQSTEEQVVDQFLVDIVLSIIKNNLGEREALLFKMRQLDDKDVATVKAHFNISAPRIRRLLQNARELLQQHPEVLEWYNQRLPASDADDSAPDDEPLL